LLVARGVKTLIQGRADGELFWYNSDKNKENPFHSQEKSICYGDLGAVQ
jgi:hypothetical protein